MKITLWMALCGLCITVGHVFLGVLGVLLLLGCVPMPQGHQPDPERRERVPHLV